MEAAIPIHFTNRVISHKLAFVNAVDTREGKYEAATKNLAEAVISSDFKGEGAMYPNEKATGREEMQKVLCDIRGACGGITHDVHRPTVSLKQDGNLLTSTMYLQTTRFEKEAESLATGGVMVHATDTWRIGKGFGAPLTLEANKNEVAGGVNPSKRQDVISEYRRNRLLCWITMWLSLVDESLNNPAEVTPDPFKAVVHPEVVLEGGAWEGSGFDHLVSWTKKNVTAMSEFVKDSHRVVSSVTVTNQDDSENADIEGTIQLKWTATSKSDGQPMTAGVEAHVVLENDETQVFPKLKKASRKFLFKSDNFTAAFEAALKKQRLSLVPEALEH